MAPLLGIPQQQAASLNTEEPAVVDDSEHSENESEGNADLGDLIDSEDEDEDEEVGTGDKWDEDGDPAVIHGGVEEALVSAVEGLNIDAWLLKDYLSDIPVAPPEPAPKGKGKGKAVGSHQGSETRVLQESDWTMGGK